MNNEDYIVTHKLITLDLDCYVYIYGWMEYYHLNISPKYWNEDFVFVDEIMYDFRTMNKIVNN